jgi:hypothetical protein
VQKIVAVFREAYGGSSETGRRTLWLNLGDRYARSRSAWGLKAKDLVGIPWRGSLRPPVLMAGILRSDIIWSQAEPGAGERDATARRRATSTCSCSRSEARYFLRCRRGAGEGKVRRGRKGTEIIPRRLIETGFAVPDFLATKEHYYPSHRNRRDVWRIATPHTPDAHFVATFPEKLVEPCIRAGTSERGACPKCGAPWRRVVERLPTTGRNENKTPAAAHAAVISARVPAKAT